ncbi:hypothetical protein OSB04_009822 [Centaurea solstitialis]|uniref:Uncharacterized protein n=1 Tax=Centaurea solstitialis TaxID=347529 RepID=A0AA38T6C6_9ASTR|nr:hypothetical protein OSB04_009822 [Centaurea solstitialis]
MAVHRHAAPSSSTTPKKRLQQGIVGGLPTTMPPSVLLRKPAHTPNLRPSQVAGAGAGASNVVCELTRVKKRSDYIREEQKGTFNVSHIENDIQAEAFFRIRHRCSFGRSLSWGGDTDEDKFGDGTSWDEDGGANEKEVNLAEASFPQLLSTKPNEAGISRLTPKTLALMAVHRHVAASNSTRPKKRLQQGIVGGLPTPIPPKLPRNPAHAPNFRPSQVPAAAGTVVCELTKVKKRRFRVRRKAVVLKALEAILGCGK